MLGGDGPHAYNCTVPAKNIPGATTLGFDIFIIFGVLISYVPQWVTIIYRKSSDGISVYFLFIGSLSAFWSVCNAVLLQFKVGRAVTNSATVWLGLAL